jgi:polyribonucleotide nucleotidyltransferase
MKKISIEFEGKTISLETGRLAKQANGAVYATYGETAILATAVASADDTQGKDFLALTVDYVEKSQAAGKIPGGFFKREGRQSETEILTSRLIDRPIRPLLPEGYNKELQVITTVLSADIENTPDLLAILGASAALYISSIPFFSPIAALRIGYINEQLVVNPTFSQMKESALDLVVVCSADAIVMVEGSAREVSEEIVLKALNLAMEKSKPLIKMQEDLRKEAGKPKKEFVAPMTDVEFRNKVERKLLPDIIDAHRISDKLERYESLRLAFDDCFANLVVEDPENEEKKGEVLKIFEELRARELRKQVLEHGKRIAGRKTDEIRQISIEVGVLPRTHGSALFTRGETQALVVTTLGTSDDEQKIDALEGETFRTFMLHYNFPPFSVGEVKPLRSPGRREIGHGALASKSFAHVLPMHDEFPYTIRVVSDILESNGSSSMATVCGTSLSLMDAGVPIKSHVAGIAMGLVKEGDKHVILSDILGDEDHIGDMDFKVAGTEKGITGIQMDIKIAGVNEIILKDALEQARVGRLFILDKMNKALTSPRADISVHAPRIISIQINPEKVREVIGPGGKMIKYIIEQTGVKIEVEDSGKINIASSDSTASDQAVQMIRDITAEPEIGKIYRGRVQKIMEYGAFVEIMPNTDGLLHISQLDNRRVDRVTDVIKEGEMVDVKVIGIEPNGKVRLSRKDAFPVKK